MEQHGAFRARTIDDDARLLEQSYRLRYQVYCVERRFIDAAAYPNQQEVDEFDAESVHLGVVDSRGELAATARLIKANPRGFPMFRHCAFFPEVQTLDSPQAVPLEVSRVAISREYARHRAHGSTRNRFEPFLTLVKAMVQGGRRAGATHLMGATDAALHRWLVHFGLPYRISGPAVDYYGPVAPCIMSLRELDEIIVSGRFPALERIGVGWDPRRWPEHHEAGLLSC